MSDHAAQFANVTVTEYESSADLLVRGQVAAYRHYGHDIINVGPGLSGIPEAFGAKVALPANSTPYVAEPALQDLAGIARLKSPDPESSARLPLFLQAAERAVREVGDEVFVSMTVAAPFTTACNIYGTERLLRELSKNAEQVHELLHIVTDVILSFCRAAIARGARIGLADPTASGSVISTRAFETFAYPYLCELVQGVKATPGGAAPTIHICGRSQRIWTHLADTGTSALSVDDVVDLAETKVAVGNRIAVIGNIRPTATMYLGTPEDVRHNARECLQKAFDTPKGVVLGLGCGLPVNTPQENVLALVQAAREYGRYPLTPEAFAA
jgi:uroporphyrinogen decarboxylase